MRAQNVRKIILLDHEEIYVIVASWLDLQQVSKQLKTSSVMLVY